MHQTPASLFSAASLHVVVPSVPLEYSAQDDEDEWVTRVASLAERDEVYYDEELPFYLVVQLSKADSARMSRQQASALLTPAATAPHMTLSADLTYVEGCTDIEASHPLHTSNELELELSASAEIMTPVPSTSTVTAPQPPSHVPLWSRVFTHASFTTIDPAKGKAKEGHGRVWVGQSSSSQKWTAVYEFRGDIAYVNSHLREPKLSVVVTVTFKDDPRLDDIVLGVENGTDKADEYLLESFDDVNLLDGMDPALGLHLPASRLPLPTKSTKTTVRRMSRRSLSLTSADAPIFPTIRRAFRRVLAVRQGANVRMRLVPCPINTTPTSDEDSMAMSVALEGAGVGFEVQNVGIEVTGGPSSNDVEVKPVDRATFPLVLGKRDRYNLIYALEYTGQDVPAAMTDDPTYPLQVANSPSQRFTSAAMEPNATVDTTRAPKMSPWLRYVTITVTGRPQRDREPVFPTAPFASKWKCVIDIQPSVIAASIRHPIPLAPVKAVQATENVAGNPKYTVAGLADLAQRSPRLARRALPPRPDEAATRERPSGMSLQESASMARSASQAQRQSYANHSIMAPVSGLPSSTGDVVVTITVQSLRKGQRINLLDVFLVEVFVLNKSDQVRRFRVGVPPSTDSPLVALENQVRIGPLVPLSCHSVRIRFMAIRPGTHVLSELTLLDVATAKETRLKNPVQVVVV